MATFRTDGWTDGQWRAEVLGCPGGANEVLGCPGQSKFLLFCPEEDLNSPKKMSIFFENFFHSSPKISDDIFIHLPKFSIFLFLPKTFSISSPKISDDLFLSFLLFSHTLFY